MPGAKKCAILKFVSKQSRYIGVKCLANGELLLKRKGILAVYMSHPAVTMFSEALPPSLIQQIYCEEVTAMKNIITKFSSSARELKSLRSLMGIAVLVALSVVLSLYSIPISPSLRIGIGFLVTAVQGMLFGPVAGAIGAGMADIIGYFIKPDGAFFFGFTITAMLGAIIYGLFFYQNKGSLLPRVIISKTFINLTVNTLLNTVWMSMLLGKAVNVLIVPRFIKNLIMLPFQIVLLYVVLVVVDRLRVHGLVKTNSLS